MQPCLPEAEPATGVANARKIKRPVLKKVREIWGFKP